MEPTRQQQFRMLVVRELIERYANDTEHSIPGEATSLIYWPQAAASTSMWLSLDQDLKGEVGGSYD